MSLQTSMNVTDDPWEIGHMFSHRGMWAFYSTSNYLGAVLNTILIWGLMQQKKKTSVDVFLIGHASGCAMMSVPCATQCAINWASGTNRFQRGWIACEIEAFAHVSAIMVQFFSITMIALRNYLSVVHRHNMSVRVAWIIVLGMWTVGETVTYGFASISDVVLMPAGAYCFYDFKSPLIYAWFAPIMVSGLIVTAFCFARIFQYTNRAINDLMSSSGTTVSGPIFNTMTVAKNSIIWWLVFLIGWFPAVIECLYTLIVGHMSEVLDLLLAVCGSLHSVFVPIVHGIRNPRFRRWLARFAAFRPFLPQFKITKVHILGTGPSHYTVKSKSPDLYEEKTTPLSVNLPLSLNTTKVTPTLTDARRLPGVVNS